MREESKVARSKAHARLGQLLRATRINAKKTMREVGYSSGHISNVENGRVVPSVELIDVYIGMGGDPGQLRAALSEVKDEIEARRRNHRGKSPVNAACSKKITLESPVDEIASSYRTNCAEHFYRVDERGVIRESTAIVTVTPHQRDAIFYSCYQDYISDQRPGVLRVEGGMGCEVAKIEQGQGSLIVLYLDRSKAMTCDGSNSFTFSYKVTVGSNVRAAPLLRWGATRDCDRYSVRVQFSPACLPKNIRWFRGMRRDEHKLPPQSNQFLPDSPSGFYFWDFHDMRHENSGLAWEW